MRPNINVYTKTGCGFSAALTAFLNTFGVPHTVVNIAYDKNAQERLDASKLDRDHTPFIDYGDGKLYQRPNLEEVHEFLERLEYISASKAA